MLSLHPMPQQGFLALTGVPVSLQVVVYPWGLRVGAQSSQHHSVQQLERQRQPWGGAGRWPGRHGQESGQ